MAVSFFFVVFVPTWSRKTPPVIFFGRACFCVVLLFLVGLSSQPLLPKMFWSLFSRMNLIKSLKLVLCKPLKQVDGCLLLSQVHVGILSKEITGEEVNSRLKQMVQFGSPFIPMKLHILDRFHSRESVCIWMLDVIWCLLVCCNRCDCHL